MLRDIADLFAHEYQLQTAFGAALLVLGEVSEKLGAALALIDTSHIDKVVAVYAEFLTESFFVRLTWDINTCAHYFAGNVPHIEKPLYKGFFLVGEEYISFRERKDILKRLEVYERFFVGCGDEYRLVSHLGETIHSQVVEVGYEYENVVFIVAFTDIAYCVRTVRALLLEPYFLGIGITLPRSQVLSVEFVEIICTWLIHIETQYMNSVYILLIGGVVVIPCGVIQGFRGYNVHLILLRKPFGDKTGVILRAAVDFHSVTLIYQCYPFHIVSPVSVPKKLIYFCTMTSQSKFSLTYRQPFCPIAADFSLLPRKKSVQPSNSK